MDWQKLIGSAAPVLATAVAGPAGGAAVNLIASALGLETAEPEAVARAIEADPEAAAKLRRIEADHRAELFRLSIADTQDARAREVALAQSGQRDVAVPLLAAIVVVGFFGLTAFMMFRPLPAESLGPVNQLFGALVAGFGAVLQYYFGSSVGSKQKDALMAGRRPNG